jgi:hypothetical protein
MGALLLASCRSAPPPPPHAPSAEERAAQARTARARDVQLLGSRSFVTRSRAAERLVAAGEASLPALGAAGPLVVEGADGVKGSATQPVIRSVLADLPYGAVRDHLGAPWPVVRRQAAAELGRRGKWVAVPRLIDHLSDEDRGVRSASALALRRLTNHFFGYEASSSLSARRDAERKWRDWWNVEGRARLGQDDRERNG